MRPVDVFGVHSGIGGHTSGSEFGARTVREAGLLDWLAARGTEAAWHDIGDAPSAGDPELDSRIDRVAAVCRALADGVARSVGAGNLALALGGDHSMAVGTWAGAANALQAQGPLGLVWIDAHMDSHTPGTSPSDNPHGMPVAHLLGRGSPALAAIAAPGPALRPDKLCLVGVRSFEPEEAALLDGLGVRVIYMDEVKARGLDAAMDEAFAIAADGTAGYGVSLDLDALDPADVPGTGSPVAGGIAGADGVRALAGLAHRPGLVCIEIAEFNPTLDTAGVTAALIRSMVEAMFRDRAET